MFEQKTTLSVINVSEKQVMISTNTANLPLLKKSKTYAQTKKHYEGVWMLRLETGTLKSLTASLSYLQDALKGRLNNYVMPKLPF